MSEGAGAPVVESANLDLLRSAAVSFVVVFHLMLFFAPERADGARSAWGGLGYWGVLVFFVHTCLVLMRSLERLQRRIDGRSLFVEFMVRRLFRLFPVSVLTVVAVVLLRLPVAHLHDGQFVAAPARSIDVVANMLLVQNLLDVDSVVAPLWSLPYELQMYLVLPAIFLFVQRRAGARRALFLWLGAFAAGLLWDRHRVLLMPCFAPCFLAGVVAFKGRAGRAVLPWAAWPLLFAAITAACLALPSNPTRWLCCLALGLLFPQVGELPDGAVRRVCRLVARYSYGAYLTHFILVWVAFVLLGAWPRWASAAVFAATLVGLPIALYHGVEAPMIRFGARTASWVRIGRLGPMAPRSAR